MSAIQTVREVLRGPQKPVLLGFSPVRCWPVSSNIGKFVGWNVGFLEVRDGRDGFNDVYVEANLIMWLTNANFSLRHNSTR